MWEGQRSEMVRGKRARKIVSYSLKIRPFLTFYCSSMKRLSIRKGQWNGKDKNKRIEGPN